MKDLVVLALVALVALFAVKKEKRFLTVIMAIAAIAYIVLYVVPKVMGQEVLPMVEIGVFFVNQPDGGNAYE